MNPSTTELQLVANRVLTTGIGLTMYGATMVMLHISTRVEVVQTEFNLPDVARLNPRLRLKIFG